MLPAGILGFMLPGEPEEFLMRIRPFSVLRRSTARPCCEERRWLIAAMGESSIDDKPE